MQKHKTDKVGDCVTSNQVTMYLAKGRSERSKAFYRALRCIRSWFVGR